MDDKSNALHATSMMDERPAINSATATRAVAPRYSQ
jgi:hypothetical protein